MAWIMFINVQSIQDSTQDSKEVTQKKSCAHEIIHLNIMHGSKHKTEFICWRMFLFMNGNTF